MGGLLDIVSSGGVTDYRHYIYAGNEPVAIDSRKSNGTNAFYYLLSDQEGSISKVTNSSGAVAVGESFTAYGNRRNSTTWSGAPSSSDLTTIAGISRHGYTFQDALGQMGLNDMVGRVQDAVTGRFLSPDPYIPDAADPQSYNRYSYVDNNPLTYSDPSGFDAYPTVAPLNQITVTGANGGLGDLGTGFGGLNGTTASPADQNDIEVAARLDAHAANQAAKGSKPAGQDSGNSQGGQSSQQSNPSQNNYPTVPSPISITITNTTEFGLGGFFALNALLTNGFDGANLYRAVGPAELSDILATGAFRNPNGIVSKYFTNSAENAAAYGQKATEVFGDEPYTVVGGNAPPSVLQGSEQVTTSDIPGGLPTYVVPSEELPFVEPVLPGFIIF